MRQGAASAGQLTIGMKDRRITRVGGFLRKYKLDELPQLINVLVGQMSLVGPRPEVKKYVDLYTAEQRRVLEVRPGLTDYASLYYIRENELLGAAPDPEYTYIHEVMPDKLRLALKYMDEQGVEDFFAIHGTCMSLDPSGNAHAFQLLVKRVAF